jgi:tetratricopeptide (TPR) repeat protein
MKRNADTICELSTDFKKLMMKLFFSVFILIFLATGCTPEYVKLNNSGYKKALAKEYDAAFKDFDSSIKKNDKYWLAYSNRGGYYLIQQEYKKAMDDFNTSITLHKRNEFAYDGRGLCKEELNDYTGALADFRRAIKYNSKFNIAYSHLGMLLADMDSCEQAVHYLNIAIERKAFNDCIDEQQLIYLRNKCEKNVQETKSNVFTLWWD